MWSDSSMAIAILSFLDQVCFLIIEHKDSFYKDVFRNERFPPLLKCFEELKNHFKNYLLIMLSNEFLRKNHLGFSLEQSQLEIQAVASK